MLGTAQEIKGIMITMHVECPHCLTLLVLELRPVNGAYYNRYVCTCGQMVEIEVKTGGWKEIK